MALADLDHFKTINDTHGHAAGDQVLAFAAGLFVSGVRPYDMIFRYGGEEFLFCLPGAGLEQAAMILERLHKRLATSSIRLRSGERIKVTTSIGVAELCDGETPEDALERADKALYRAKQNGRNRIEVDDGSA